MSALIPLTILIVAGIVLSLIVRGPKMPGPGWGMLLSLIAILGGCVGSLAWLDAETSGRGGGVTDVNPFIFAGLFIFGSVAAAVYTVQLIIRWLDKRAEARKQAGD